MMGLSPHLRGNRLSEAIFGHCRGSIPALAGEPEPRAVAKRQVRVYPRTCGGTVSLTIWDMRRSGLSPHLRGNQGLQAMHESASGSIPALAGNRENDDADTK